MGIHDLFISSPPSALVRPLDYTLPFFLGRLPGHLRLGCVLVYYDRYHGSARCHIRGHGHRRQEEGVFAQYADNHSPVHPPIQYRTHVTVHWLVGRQARLLALLSTVRRAHNPGSQPLVVDRLCHMPPDLSTLLRHSSIQVLLHHLRSNQTT